MKIDMKIMRRQLQKEQHTNQFKQVNIQYTTNNVLSNFMKSEGLIQIVDMPTHKEGGRIDHCYVTSELKKTISIDLIITL